jgi:hypothetical protein
MSQPSNSGYQPQQPNSGYQQKQPNSGYQQQQPNSGYQQQQPNSGYQPRQPSPVYQQQQCNLEYQQQQHNLGYQQQQLVPPPMSGFNGINNRMPSPDFQYSNTGGFAHSNVSDLTSMTPPNYQPPSYPPQHPHLRQQPNFKQFYGTTF